MPHGQRCSSRTVVTHNPGGNINPVIPFRIIVLRPDPGALVFYVVHQDVLPKPLRCGVEGAAFVDPGHLPHEVDEIVAGVQHENVDGYVVPSAPLHLLKRDPDGLEARGPPEEGQAILHVGRRLTVGYHDDLLVLTLTLCQ